MLSKFSFRASGGRSTKPNSKTRNAKHTGPDMGFGVWIVLLKWPQQETKTVTQDTAAAMLVDLLLLFIYSPLVQSQNTGHVVCTNSNMPQTQNPQRLVLAQVVAWELTRLTHGFRV